LNDLIVQQLESKTQHLSCPHLPLAVYREVVAHLRQVDGVEVGLIPQQSQEFDYLQSQIAGLWLDCTTASTDIAKVETILAYYAQRYGDWQTLMRK
jgi:hypothetical protein